MYFEAYKVDPPREIVATIGGSEDKIRLLVIWAEDDGYSIGYDSVSNSFELIYNSVDIETFDSLKDAMNF
jgi:hypothetical protein